MRESDGCIVWPRSSKNFRYAVRISLPFTARSFRVAPVDSVDYLEFYITLVQSGRLTPRLFALEPWSRVFLGKKISGMFTLADVPDGKDLVLVATGTGLAGMLGDTVLVNGVNLPRLPVDTHT